MGLDWCVDNPCEAVDAPRVDTEERAREIWEDWGRDQFKFETFDEYWEWLTEDEFPVDCERCRIWEEYGAQGGSFLSSSCSWRGKRLRFVGNRRIEWLINQAHSDMTPHQMEDFADRIRSNLIEDPDEFYSLDEDDLETLDAAANWLEFWSSKGCSMYAWF